MLGPAGPYMGRKRYISDVFTQSVQVLMEGKASVGALSHRFPPMYGPSGSNMGHPSAAWLAWFPSAKDGILIALHS